MRTIVHTFEIKASRLKPRIVGGNAENLEAGALRLVESGPDELMVRWNNLPRATRVTLYAPDLDASEILRLAGRNYEAEQLQQIDAHTILCLPGDVTYVPIPPGRTRNIAALITFDLPETIRHEQAFHVSVHQVSGRPRSMLGAFQVSIPVRGKTTLLEPEKRRLSVLRYIAQSIPSDDQWRPVFDRYLSRVADRVSGFGGDPDQIAPSPDGSERDEAAERCAGRGWLVSALVAILFPIAALHPIRGYIAEVLVAAVVAFAVALWVTACKPSVWRFLQSLIVGIGLGAALTALLLVLNVAAEHGLVALIIAALALGLTVLIGLSKRCFRLTGL